MKMPELINKAVHTIDVHHYEEYASGRNWLKVWVSFVDKNGQPNKIISDCYIEKVVLEAGNLYEDLDSWIADQAPRLTERVIKRLYGEKRRGNTWKS